MDGRKDSIDDAMPTPGRGYSMDPATRPSDLEILRQQLTQTETALAEAQTQIGELQDRAVLASEAESVLLAAVGAEDGDTIVTIAQRCVDELEQCRATAHQDPVAPVPESVDVPVPVADAETLPPQTAPPAGDAPV